MKLNCLKDLKTDNEENNFRTAYFDYAKSSLYDKPISSSLGTFSK